MTNRKRNRRRSVLAGHRALAMLSCALALLSAHPWAQAQRANVSAEVEAVSALPATFSSSPVVAGRFNQLIAPAGSRAMRGDKRAPLRLLATWQLLHRFVVMQLMPGEQFSRACGHFAVAWPAEPCRNDPSDILPSHLTRGKIQHSDQGFYTSHEEHFAILHLLLAPPTSCQI